MTSPRVVILGGGFAGLYAARSLSGAPVSVTLVDRKNHHLFQPMLYQVATAALNPADIAAPIRSILSGQKNCRVLLAEARGVDTKAGVVETDGAAIPYDYLLIGTGASHSTSVTTRGRRMHPGSRLSKTPSTSDAVCSWPTRAPNERSMRRSAGPS